MAAAKAIAATAINLTIGFLPWLGMLLGYPVATFDHNFGQAPPSMEFKAALASSIVPYLPNSLYLALLVEVSSLPGMTRHCLVVLSTMR